MNNIKSYGVTALIAVLVVLGYGVLFPSTATTVVEKTVGALAGPDIPSPYLQWGGVRTWNYSMNMAIASTTCSFLSPASTSTLRFAAAKVDSSSKGATLQYEWGSAATAYATTTSFGLAPIATVAKGTFLASTTDAGTAGDNLDPAIVFAPSTYLNLKIGSSSPLTQVGSCSAQFIEVL